MERRTAGAFYPKARSGFELTIAVGETPEQQIRDSHSLEAKGVATYNEGTALCIETKDAGSRDLMERMVVESEESIDWAETQFDHIKMIGIEKYLAQQMGEKAE